MVLLAACSSTGSKTAEITKQAEGTQADDPFLIPSRLPDGKQPSAVFKPATPPAEPMPDRAKAPISQPQMPGMVGPFLPKGIEDADGWAKDNH